MRLGEKQELFCRLEGALIAKAHDLGFAVRGGDAYRDPRIHGDYGTKKGYGAAYSMHKLKLARDLLLFKEGVYLTKTEDYKILGEWWVEQHELCRWGGSFSRSDGNHFSITHDGRW